MRVKKRKTNRKTLEFYKLNYGIRPPYRVLVDGTFVTSVVKLKVLIREQFNSLLMNSSVPVVSSCVLQELRSFGHRLIEAVVIAKHFYRHQCNHVQNDGPSQNIFFDTTEEESCDMKKEEKMPVDKQNIVDNARDCILQLIGKKNHHKYIVATQDVQLKEFLRKIPGVPIITIQGPGFILEPPSDISKTTQQQLELIKRLPLPWEKNHLKSLQTTDDVSQKTRHRKRKKGKNPLSALPKKKIKKGL